MKPASAPPPKKKEKGGGGEADVIVCGVLFYYSSILLGTTVPYLTQLLYQKTANANGMPMELLTTNVLSYLHLHESILLALSLIP